MKNTLIFIIILISSLQVSGQYKNYLDQAFIEVTGKAELEIVPNEITVEITLNESDTKGKVSIEKLEKQLIKTLKSLDINTEENLKLNDYSSSFKFYRLKKDDIHKSKTYELMLHDSKKVGPLFYNLEQEGIANLKIARLNHSNMEELRLKVKTSAIKAAKAKANALAEAIGQETGKAIHIQEQNNNNYGVPNTFMKIRGSNNIIPEDLPNIEFENIKLNAQVHCKFILK